MFAPHLQLDGTTDGERFYRNINILDKTSLINLSIGVSRAMGKCLHAK